MTDPQLKTLAALLERINSCGFQAKPLGCVEGPILTSYKFLPIGKTRVSHLTSLAQDFAVATSSEAVSVSRIPGESAVGISVPLPLSERKYLQFRDVFSELHKDYVKTMPIPLLLGMDQYGTPVVEDLSLMPHLLISGSTGSGKSTLVKALITAIVYNVNTYGVNFVLSDTKMVEFTRFVGTPHLIFDPLHTVFQVCEKMEWLCQETERRLAVFSKNNVTNIQDWNAFCQIRMKENERLPRIVFVIDELADLLTNKTKHEDATGSKTTLSKMAEAQLNRIVARSRASGIHVIAATQRPSVDIVTGAIKANFPARISFRLPSEADSRTVLGGGGAEQLLMRGDMLFLNPAAPGLRRIHAPIAPIEDVEACLEFAKARATN